MYPVLGLLQYILYNLILNRIISGRWGPALGTLLLAPQNVNFMPADFVAPPSIHKDENCVTSQYPEFYAEDALMLSQVIYLGLLWLGLIVLLNPGVTIISEATLVVNHQFYVDLGVISVTLITWIFHVRIDNLLPQKTRAQGWDLNLEPTFLQAAGPMDQGPACPHFFWD
ncbi:hypothetical protein DSO57_1024859 [Entomophthora muscae]|uniref:Uncharacterized protein n=1 Tax=Entomophthora muscae TaxID=34485 RepID=A0ACC2S4A4_9FUNG|nr:hypothetical protein DSO57_1024859 [Entomophthora muscae]